MTNHRIADVRTRRCWRTSHRAQRPRPKGAFEFQIARFPPARSSAFAGGRDSVDEGAQPLNRASQRPYLRRFTREEVIRKGSRIAFLKQDLLAGDHYCPTSCCNSTKNLSHLPRFTNSSQTGASSQSSLRTASRWVLRTRLAHRGVRFWTHSQNTAQWQEPIPIRMPHLWQRAASVPAQHADERLTLVMLADSIKYHYERGQAKRGSGPTEFRSTH